MTDAVQNTSDAHKPNRIYDLLYTEDQGLYQETQKNIVSAFPTLKVSDGSDEIHRYRLVVEGEIDEDQWLIWVMRSGLYELSLMCQTMVLGDTDRLKDLMHQAIELLKTEKGTDDDGTNKIPSDNARPLE